MGKIAFRVDASAEIGVGHAMRCLTLADRLRERGWEILMISGQRPGNQTDMLRARDFDVIELPLPLDPPPLSDATAPVHAAWLGQPWQRDARATAEVIEDFGADLVAIDHYAIDKRWEERIGVASERIVIIDDLADRDHCCALLIDANLGRRAADYAARVPESAIVAAGPSFALLRPEFARLRPASLARRGSGGLRKLLVSMGGSDIGNMTGLVLDVLKGNPIDGCEIDVVMGSHARWRNAVQLQAAAMPMPTRVLIDTANMAELMLESDLAIGAAGITAWERCCLGLPALIAILADNQRPGAVALAEAGAACLLGDGNESVAHNLPGAIAAISHPERLGRMSDAAAAVTDGTGAAHVADLIEQLL